MIIISLKEASKLLNISQKNLSILTLYYGCFKDALVIKNKKSNELKVWAYPHKTIKKFKKLSERNKT